MRWRLFLWLPVVAVSLPIVLALVVLLPLAQGLYYAEGWIEGKDAPPFEWWIERWLLW